MAWTSTQGSHIFQYLAKNLFGGFVQSNVAPSGMSSTGFLGDTMKFALFGNTGTPDYTNAGAGTALLTSYNGTASQWVTANEVTGSGYTAGGFTPLAGKSWAVDAVAGPCFISTPGPSWTTATITAYGGLLYDSSITATAPFGVNQGICFNYFGGVQTVTAGTFTVSWATAGSTANTIFNISV